MKTIRQKRLEAIYNYRNGSTSSKRDELLGICLAIINDKQIKIIVEDLNLKIK